MGKYLPLAHWLNNTAEDAVTLSLTEIERIVGFQLPASAHRHQPFWAGSAVNPELAAAGWHAYARLAKSAIEFRRTSVKPVVRVVARSEPPAAASALPPDIVLLGCVKSKRAGRWPARNLYTSSLFLGRMAHAESTGKPWFVLSAKYGLVAPDDEIEDYDVSLIKASRLERESWARNVLAGLDEKYGALSNKVVEIHAGLEYRATTLLKGVRDRGGTISVPLSGMRFGEQLRWYARQSSPLVATPRAPHVRRGAVRPSRSTTAETEVSNPERMQRVARVTQSLSRAFMDGLLDLSARPNAPSPTWESMPEFVAARALRGSGATPRQLRVFMTFMAAMDRAREADRLWRKGAELCAAMPWVFDPPQVVARSFAELGDALSRGGVSQRHGPDSAAWRTIAESLENEQSPAPVRRAVFEGVGSAQELLPAIRALDGRRTWFPFLAGPKISQMWVRMMAIPGGAAIDGLEHLDVAVDTQVRKVTEYLRVTNTAGRPLDEIRGTIQAAWKAHADQVAAPIPLSGTVAGLDPGLWFMGKWGCTFCERAGRKIPVSDVCGACRFGDDV